MEKQKEQNNSDRGRKRIGVIFGGRSSEKEVSLAGGRHVYYHLDRTKFFPMAIYWDSEARFWQIPESLVIRNTCKEIEEHLKEKGAERILYDELKEKIDLAFLVTHGKYGDDGCLQGLLEILGVPYTGSGVLSAALGMDKSIQREFMKSDPKINLPQYLVINKDEWDKERERTIKEIETKFNYPLVSKPTREGSTIGVMLIRSRDDIEKGMRKALEYDNSILLEKYIKGREFSCIVFGNDQPTAFLPTETIYGSDIFTYDHKYLPGASKKITPIKIDQKIIRDIQDQSVRTYRALNCRGYARIDGFIEENGRVLITDPNSAASTGMGPSSWTYHQAALAGLDIPHFLTKIIEMAIEAHQNKKGAL